MSDTVQNPSISEDIAFLRALAVEGQKTPFRGGVSLAAGLIWGSASLYSWWAISSASAAGGKWWTSPIVETANWSWLAAAAVFALAGVPLRMYRRAPGAGRTAAAAWGGMGLACWVVSAAVVIAAVRTQQWAIFSVLPPMIMALYGGAWLVSAVAFRAPWQRWVGALSLLSSLLLAYTAAKPVEYLVFALSLYGLAGVPGLIAVLRARRA